MKKQDHADEAMQISAIRSASFFVASLFANGGYQQRHGHTVRHALAQAAALEAEFTSHRRAMIYAVSRDGVSTFITNDLIQQLRRKS